MFFCIGRHGTAFRCQDSGQPVVRITERRRTSNKKRKGVAVEDGRIKGQIGTPREGILPIVKIRRLAVVAKWEPRHGGMVGTQTVTAEITGSGTRTFEIFESKILTFT